MIATRLGLDLTPFLVQRSSITCLLTLLKRQLGMQAYD